MNTIQASSIATSVNPPLSLEQAIDAVQTLLTQGNPLSIEERNGIERLQALITAHSERSLERLLNGWTEANYTSLLGSLNTYCESEYNDYVKTHTHACGGIEERVESVRSLIRIIHRHELTGIEYVTTQDIRFASSINYPTLLKEGTNVTFRNGRWIYQRRKNSTAFLIPSNKVRRLKPDHCKK